MNFGATSVPGGVALTWTSEKDDHGLVDYQYSMDDGEKWKTAGKTGAKVVSDVKPGEHTFMLRALGRSDNSTSTEAGDDIPGAAASKMITVPMPTPTLPEIAALFLAMLLLGSGAYLLRRRQSGGLTARVEDWLARRRSSAFGTGVHQHLLRTDGHDGDRPAA